MKILASGNTGLAHLSVDRNLGLGLISHIVKSSGAYELDVARVIDFDVTTLR